MKTTQFKIKCSMVIKLCFFCVVIASNSHAQIISTYAGNGVPSYNGDGGAATAAGLKESSNIIFHSSGNVYILDQGNYVIRKVNSIGIINTIAGNGTPGYSGDGGPATSAQFKNIGGGVFDAMGNLIVTDPYSHCVRKISTTGIITTVAGTGMAGYSGDGGSATIAKLNNPLGIVIDDTGNLYIGDVGNYRIRKINTVGIISTVAGNGSFVYGGGGISATSEGIAPGNMYMKNNLLYFSHSSGNRICKIDLAGIVTTIAGTGSIGFSGDGGGAIAAQLHTPKGICIDATGDMYFSDGTNNRIRKINTAGIISTIAGIGSIGYSGDGAPAINAQLAGPAGLGIKDGDLYICDAGNSRIRVIKGIVSVKDVVDGKNIRVYPNPAVDELMLEVQEGCNYSVHNIAGQVVKEGRLGKGTQTIRIDDMASGTYVISLIKDGVVYGAKCFVKQ